MLEADGEKFHFLSCLVHGVTCKESMHSFPTLVKKQMEVIVSITWGLEEYASYVIIS